MNEQKLVQKYKVDFMCKSKIPCDQIKCVISYRSVI